MASTKGDVVIDHELTSLKLDDFPQFYPDSIHLIHSRYISPHLHRVLLYFENYLIYTKPIVI